MKNEMKKQDLKEFAVGAATAVVVFAVLLIIGGLCAGGWEFVLR